MVNSSGVGDTGYDTSIRTETDGAGNWITTWTSNENLGSSIGTDEDILFSKSTDNGFTWTSTAVLNTTAVLDTGEDRRSDITTNGSGTWLAVWQSTETLSGSVGTDADIFYAVSNDVGATWSTVGVVNTTANSDSGDDVSPDIATDGLGNWIVVWSSRENLGESAGTDDDIVFSVSTDDGVLWSTPSVLNTNFSTDTGGDILPRIAMDSGGNWCVVWISDEDLGGLIGTDYDVFISVTNDGGSTWSAPATLNSNASTDIGDDLDPMIESNGSGSWVTCWHSNENLGSLAGVDQDLFVSLSTDNGASWSSVSPLNTNFDSDTGDDFDVQIASDGASRWIASWRSTEDLGGIGTDWDIFISESNDNGSIWSPPIVLNANATTDSGTDQGPKPTTDKNGNWIVAWVSFEDIGGSGTDQDVFAASFTIIDPPPSVPLLGFKGNAVLFLIMSSIGFFIRKRVV